MLSSGLEQWPWGVCDSHIAQHRAAEAPGSEHPRSECGGASGPHSDRRSVWPTPGPGLPTASPCSHRARSRSPALVHAGHGSAWMLTSHWSHPLNRTEGAPWSLGPGLLPASSVPGAQGPRGPGLGTRDKPFANVGRRFASPFQGFPGARHVSKGGNVQEDWTTGHHTPASPLSPSPCCRASPTRNTCTHKCFYLSL